ncbi:MAG: hypothetical protein OEM82_15240 [Acidobacteriota bacterium]|nr:hypothetical protein [Acidobacteriota bacterium]MDH3528190.1 hypothetical protein [Acidobacteriota bacterium]
MSKIQDTIIRPKNVFRRRFIVRGLPEGLSPSDPHLQIFDNYIAGSDLRFRKVRNPEDNQRSYSIEKSRLGIIFSRIDLNQSEYEAFRHLRGRETRKNRYSGSENGHILTYDVFLGPLWGLTVLKIDYQTEVDERQFELFPDITGETTADPFFDERNLVDLTLADLRDYLAKTKKGA